MILKLKALSNPELGESYGKILNYFFDYPTKEAGLNYLCTSLRISKTAASLAVRRLVKEGFLKLELIGRSWRISCNQQHPYNSGRKIAYHLRIVYESGIINQVYKAVPGARTIILFGSYRKGDDTENSDIDIAAEVVGDAKYKILELGSVSQLGYRQNVPATVHVFSRTNLNPNLFANIANGIVLDGFLEVRP